MNKEILYKPYEELTEYELFELRAGFLVQTKTINGKKYYRVDYLYK